MNFLAAMSRSLVSGSMTLQPLAIWNQASPDVPAAPL
jgi:hypothetical protein